MSRGFYIGKAMTTMPQIAIFYRQGSICCGACATEFVRLLYVSAPCHCSGGFPNAVIQDRRKSLFAERLGVRKRCRFYEVLAPYLNKVVSTTLQDHRSRETAEAEANERCSKRPEASPYLQPPILLLKVLGDAEMGCG